MRNELKNKVWTKPELTRLGRLGDVAVKANTLNDGASMNMNFGAAS